MKILITGSSGFIGFSLSKVLLEQGYDIVGIDNMNNYYSVKLKEKRLEILKEFSNFKTYISNIEDKEFLSKIFEKEKFDLVINLAAQAGVRYSIENPDVYIQSNIVGFFNILECCRNYNIRRLIYASSSSVYGGNEKVPFSEEDKVDNPQSLYAATKKSNELMASCYSSLYGIQCTGLRFFTVYGPWGRPDMAPMLFAKSISDGKPIKVFNNGDMIRDFTYIDDIVNGIISIVKKELDYKHKVYNIGCSNPINLIEFISLIEKELGKESEKIFMPMQPGDVYKTYADCSLLEKDYRYKPSVMIEDGVKKFINWFLKYGNLL